MLCVYTRIYIHTCICNLLSPFSIVGINRCPGLTSWDWTIYVGACPWRKLILLLLASLTTCSPSSRGRTLCSFPCSRCMFRVSCSWECMAHWPCHVYAVLSICRGPGLLPLPWCSLSFRVRVAASQGCPLEQALHCQCSLHFGQLCISV